MVIYTANRNTHQHPGQRKPPCGTTVTGQPDKAARGAKLIALALTGCLLLIMAPDNHITNDRRPYRCDRRALLAYSHLHYHHLPRPPWQPDILLSVWLCVYVCAPRHNEKLHSLSHLSLLTTTPTAVLSAAASSSCEKLSSFELLFTPPVLFCCASVRYLCLRFNCDFFFSFCSCMCLSNRWLTIRLWNCTFLTRSHKNWSGLIRLYFHRKHLAGMID